MYAWDQAERPQRRCIKDAERPSVCGGNATSPKRPRPSRSVETDDDADDEDVPPLDSTVCALGSVSVGALANNNVRLLILDLGENL